MTAIVVILGLIVSALIFLLVRRWYGTGPQPKPQPRIAGLIIEIDGVIRQGVHMSSLVRNDQAVKYAPLFVDEFGNQADAIGSAPVWSSSNPAVGDLQVAEDGLTAIFVPNGIKGDTQISILIDADPAEGVEEELVGTDDLTVLSGKARRILLQPQLINKSDLEPAPTAAPEPEPTDAPPAATDAPTPVETEAPVEVLPADPVADAPATDPVAADPAADGAGAEPAPEDDANKNV